MRTLNSGFIPEWYIPDVSERLILYQRLASLRSSGETDDLREEVYDRFGNAPVEVDTLVEIMRLRALLREVGATRLEAGPDRYTINFAPQAKIDITKVIQLVQNHPEEYRFSKAGTLLVQAQFDPSLDLSRLYRSVLELFRIIDDE